LGRIRRDPFANKLRKHEYIQHLETVRRSSYGTESTVPAAGPRPSTIYYILPIYILRKVM